MRSIFIAFCGLLFVTGISCKSIKSRTNTFHPGYYKAIAKKSRYTDSLQMYIRNDGTLISSQHRQIQHIEAWWGWQEGTWQRFGDTLITKIKAYHFSSLDTPTLRQRYGNEDTAFMVTNSYLIRDNKLIMVGSKGYGRSIGRDKQRSVDYYLVDSMRQFDRGVQKQ